MLAQRYSRTHASQDAETSLITLCAAATVCYPLDTIRRRMQMKGRTYTSQLDAVTSIWKAEGFTGYYRGWSANSIKVVPQNAIRFVSYEILKGFMGVQRRRTDT